MQEDITKGRVAFQSPSIFSGVASHNLCLDRIIQRREKVDARPKRQIRRFISAVSDCWRGVWQGRTKDKELFLRHSVCEAVIGFDLTTILSANDGCTVAQAQKPFSCKYMFVNIFILDIMTPEYTGKT